ncbi:MAG: hypothetical protein JWP36_2143 [Paucimonas sp.]|nr:hypothetical protein [Paucimonas sp.]
MSRPSRASRAPAPAQPSLLRLPSDIFTYRVVPQLVLKLRIRDLVSLGLACKKLNQALGEHLTTLRPAGTGPRLEARPLSGGPGAIAPVANDPALRLLSAYANLRRLVKAEAEKFSPGYDYVGALNWLANAVASGKWAGAPGLLSALAPDLVFALEKQLREDGALSEAIQGALWDSLASALQAVPALPKDEAYALMLAAAHMNHASGVEGFRTALLDQLSSLAPAAQLDILDRGFHYITKGAAPRLLALYLERMTDGSLYAHAHAKRLLGTVAFLLRAESAPQAAKWLKAAFKAGLLDQVRSLPPYDSQAEDGDWCLSLVAAIWQTLSPTFGTKTSTRDEFIAKVSKALEEGGWKYLGEREFKHYLSLLQQQGLNGLNIWKYLRQKEEENNRSVCVIS